MATAKLDFGSGFDVTESPADEFNITLDLSEVQHDTLAGLTDDDHTIYALLAGRAGGQTLYGGTLTTQNLTLQANAADTTTGAIVMASDVKLNSGSVIQDSDGNTRITLSTFNPYVTLSGTAGGVQIQESLALGGSTPHTNGVGMLLVDTPVVLGSGGTYRVLEINPDLAFSGGTTGSLTAMYGIAKLRGRGGSTHAIIGGLDFQAQLVGDTSYITAGQTCTVTSHPALSTRLAYAFINMGADTFTYNITNARTIYAINPSVSFINSAGTTVTLTNFYGVDISNWSQSTTGFVVTTSTQLHVGSTAGTSFSGNRFGIQIGDQSGNIASTKISYGIQIDAQDATAPSGAGGDAWAFFYGDTGTRLTAIDYKGNLIARRIQEVLTPTDVDAQNNTLTVAQIASGIVVHTSATGAGTVTTDTAANIIAGSSGIGVLRADGECITVWYINDGSQTLTFAAGASVTIADTGQVIDPNEGALLLFRRTSSTTVTMYHIGG